jgi:hypothetical protein
MATDLERLVVSLEASITKYEKSMNKALGVSNANAKKIENRWKKLDIGATAFAGFVKGAGSALVSALSLSVAIRSTANALKEFGDIADNAKAAGIDAEFFQSLAYQAKLGGVEIETLAASLAAFNKNSGLAVEGRGKMATALKALDLGLLENIRNATTQEQRIKLVADALAQETDASKKAAIATAAFGEAGLKLAGIFAGGADEIETMKVKARELGLIVDNDLIAKADQLGDEFDTTTKIVDLQLKQALVNLGPVLVWLAGLAGNIAEQIGGAIDNLKPLSEQRRSTIEGALTGIDLRQNDVNPAMTAGRSQADADALRRPLLDELKRRAMDDLRTQLTALTVPTTPAVPTLDEIDDRNEAAAAALRQADAVKELIANLEFEGQIIGKNELEQAKMNALRQAGAAATDKQRQKIIELIDANYKATAAQDALTERMDLFRDIAKDAMSGFISDLRDGKTAAEALGNVMSRIGDKLIDVGISTLLNAVLPGAGAATGLAAMFGGGRASGGPVTPGKYYHVGERGPELFAPRVPGTIIPNRGGGGGSMKVDVGVSVDDAGAIQAYVKRISGSAAAQAAATAVDISRRSMPAWQQNLATTGAP